MRKGATVGILVVAGLYAPAAVAQAPTLPTGEAGYVAVKPSGKSIVISFHRGAAGTFKLIAGRRVDVTCTAVGKARRTGATVVESDTKTLRAPKRRRAFRVALSPRSAAFCVVSRSRFSRRKGDITSTFPSRRVAVIPLTQRGAVFLDEGRKTNAMVDLAGQAEVLAGGRKDGLYPPASELERKVGSRPAALATPDATPPPGRVGVYTNARDITIVTLSATGRRLYIQTEGERFSTNVIEQFFG